MPFTYSWFIVVNDTPDGRPALDEKQKRTDSSSISPVDKLAKLDDDIDTVDMPPQGNNKYIHYKSFANLAVYIAK